MPDFLIDDKKNLKSVDDWKTTNFGSGTIKNTGTLNVVGDVNITNTSDVLTLYTLRKYDILPQPVVYSRLKIDANELTIGGGGLNSSDSIIFGISPIDIDFENNSIYSLKVIFGNVDHNGDFKINISSNATKNVKYIAINSTIKKGTINIADDGSGSVTLSGYNDREPMLIIVYG